MVLNPRDAVFAFRVIREGKLLYCRDMERVTDVIEIVSRRYAEVYPRYRQALDEIFSEIGSAPQDQEKGGGLWV